MPTTVDENQQQLTVAEALAALRQVSPAAKISGVRLITMEARYIDRPAELDEEAERTAPGKLPAWVQMRAMPTSPLAPRNISALAGIRVALPTPLSDKHALRVRAEFHVTYEMLWDSPAPEHEVAAFLRIGSLYHAWPYMREIVSSTLSRMQADPFCLEPVTVEGLAVNLGYQADEQIRRQAVATDDDDEA